MATGKVVIGFGDSMGRLSSTIIQQKVNIIQRIGSKPNISHPTVKPMKPLTLHVDHLKVMLGQRRNQALLNSFLNINDEQQCTNLLKIQKQARKRIKNITQQLGTVQLLSSDMKINKFMQQTGCKEYQAREYIMEFHQNLEIAVQAFQEREKKVGQFANKNKIDRKQAKEILKANGYNTSLFD